jgi:hypothetical protein
MPSSRFLWATVNATSAIMPAAARVVARLNGTDGRERARLRFESVLARARRSVTGTILLTSAAKPGIMHTSGAG